MESAENKRHSTPGIKISTILIVLSRNKTIGTI